MDKILEKLIKLKEKGEISDFVLMYANDDLELQLEADASTAFICLAAKHIDNLADRIIEEERE